MSLYSSLSPREIAGHSYDGISEELTEAIIKIIEVPVINEAGQPVLDDNGIAKINTYHTIDYPDTQIHLCGLLEGMKNGLHHHEGFWKKLEKCGSNQHEQFGNIRVAPHEEDAFIAQTKILYKKLGIQLMNEYLSYRRDEEKYIEERQEKYRGDDPVQNLLERIVFGDYFIEYTAGNIHPAEYSCPPLTEIIEKAGGRAAFKAAGWEDDYIDAVIQGAKEDLHVSLCTDLQNRIQVAQGLLQQKILERSDVDRIEEFARMLTEFGNTIPLTAENRDYVKLDFPQSPEIKNTLHELRQKAEDLEATKGARRDFERIREMVRHQGYFLEGFLYGSGDAEWPVGLIEAIRKAGGYERTGIKPDDIEALKPFAITKQQLREIHARKATTNAERTASPTGFPQTTTEHDAKAAVPVIISLYQDVLDGKPVSPDLFSSPPTNWIFEDPIKQESKPGNPFQFPWGKLVPEDIGISTKEFQALRLLVGASHIKNIISTLEARTAAAEVDKFELIKLDQMMRSSTYLEPDPGIWAAIRDMKGEIQRDPTESQKADLFYADSTNISSLAEIILPIWRKTLEAAESVAKDVILGRLKPATQNEFYHELEKRMAPNTRFSFAQEIIDDIRSNPNNAPPSPRQNILLQLMHSRGFILDDTNISPTERSRWGVQNPEIKAGIHNPGQFRHQA